MNELYMTCHVFTPVCTPNLDMVQESSTTFEASFDERDDDDDNATNPDSVYNNYVHVRSWINDL